MKDKRKTVVVEQTAQLDWIFQGRRYEDIFSLAYEYKKQGYNVLLKYRNGKKEWYGGYQDTKGDRVISAILYVRKYSDMEGIYYTWFVGDQSTGKIIETSIVNQPTFERAVENAKLWQTKSNNPFKIVRIIKTNFKDNINPVDVHLYTLIKADVRQGADEDDIYQKYEKKIGAPRISYIIREMKKEGEWKMKDKKRIQILKTVDGKFYGRIVDSKGVVLKSTIKMKTQDAVRKAFKDDRKYVVWISEKNKPWSYFNENFKTLEEAKRWQRDNVDPKNEKTRITIKENGRTVGVFDH